MFFSTVLLLSLSSQVSAFTRPYLHHPTHQVSVSSRRSISSNTALWFRSSTVSLDVSEATKRNVDTLQEWAQECGVQTVEGLRIVQTAPSINNPDGQDYHLVTKQDIEANTPVICVPQYLTLSSADISQELGGNLEAAESALESSDRLPLFRLIVKILSEVQAGDTSPFYPWLNALPRRFNNGVAMTEACFECLPPYASYLASQERYTFEIFLQAMQKGYLELSTEILEDIPLLQWAYNVALTRHQINWNQEDQVDKIIAPLADMLNHASFPNCEIQFDEEGNAYVVASQDPLLSLSLQK